MARTGGRTVLFARLAKGSSSSCAFWAAYNRLAPMHRSWFTASRRPRCRQRSVICARPWRHFQGSLLMPSINLNGEIFHYASAGEGLPFVFQHGMGADVTQPLSSGGNLPGWRMIAMDCRGHGQTEANLDPSRISFAQFAEDLAMLLNSLSIERAVVGGISMGAGVALAFALAHPERVTGLMLVRPAWLDHPFPPNLRWFPLAAGFLQ